MTKRHNPFYGSFQEPPSGVREEVRKGKSRAALAEGRRRQTIPHVKINNIEMKSCSKCASLKPLDEFSTLSKSSDGLNSHCKQCERTRQKHVRP
jgi:hypothetical protein